MTTPSTPRKAGPFSGNDVTTSFPFAFKVFAATDLKVVTADSTGAETVLVLDTNFSVTLNANQDTSPGGTITYPISGSPLPTGSRITAIGNLNYDQPLDLPTGGNFSPIALENQLDRATMQIQQLKEEVDRSAKMPVSYTADDIDKFTAGVVALADNVEDIETVAGSIGAVNVVADNIAEIGQVASMAGDIAEVANSTEVQVVAADLGGVRFTQDLGLITDPVTTPGATAPGAITTVAIAIDDVQAVAAGMANVTLVAGNMPGVATVADNIADVTAVADNIADVSTVAAAVADVVTVADNITDVSTVAGVSSEVAIVAANVDDVHVFSAVWQGAKSADPTVRNDGSALQAGDQYFNTVRNIVRVYGPGGWSDSVQPAAVTVTPQTFSGNGVTTSFTLSAAPPFAAACDVYISGVFQYSGTDYNVVGANVVFTSAPPAGTNNIFTKTISAVVGSVPPDGSITVPKLASILDLGILT